MKLSCDVVCSNLRLEVEVRIQVIVSLLFFVEHPNSSTDHNPLSQFLKLDGSFTLSVM
jgi:hypothetical protein